MIEIEIKAHIADMAEVRQRLVPLAHYLGPLDRKDSYYTIDTSQGVQTFRIRQEGSDTHCTIKERSIEEGVEVNHEVEFRLADPQQFLQFMELLGARAFITKHKVGERWRWRRYTVELVEVAELGYFIEIEYLADPTTFRKPQRAAIAQEFHHLLEILAIDKSKIESRRYIDMLQEKHARS